MKSYIGVVFALGIFSAIAKADNAYEGSVREVIKLYSECSQSEGLSPCLKMKALSVIERLGRMDKLYLMDGVVLSGKTEENLNEPSLEEQEKNLPRSLEAKGQALTSMIFNRIARMLGAKSLEISVPKMIESFTARKGEEDSKFGDLEELFSGGGGGGHKKGGGLGGGHGIGGGKNKKKGGGNDVKDFLMQLMAHKLAMLPLLIGGLFVLAVKALAQAKIALLIAGIIFAKKLMAQRGQQQHVEHVQVSGGGGGGGWSGGHGSGHGGGWDRRSYQDAQNLAYNGQKPT